MEQVGIILKKKENGKAVVQVTRMTACGGTCGSCHGCDSMEEQLIAVEAANPIEAQIGERVTIESQSSALLVSAWVVYLLPFLVFFACYFLAGYFGAAELVQTLLAVLGFACSFLAARLLNRRQERRASITFTIVARAGGAHA